MVALLLAVLVFFRVDGWQVQFPANQDNRALRAWTNCGEIVANNVYWVEPDDDLVTIRPIDTGDRRCLIHVELLRGTDLNPEEWNTIEATSFWVGEVK